MNELLDAIKSEIEASEEQGQNLFNTAWSIIRSYIDNPPPQDESGTSLTDEGGSGGNQGDFVHVSLDGESYALDDLLIAAPSPIGIHRSAMKKKEA